MRRHSNASERRRIQCEVANEVSSWSILLTKPPAPTPCEEDVLCRSKAPGVQQCCAAGAYAGCAASSDPDLCVGFAAQRGREYLQELRQNRLNPFWHKDPPANTCPMPSDNMPWCPEVPDY